MTYTKPVKYTKEELDSAALRDLEADATSCREQAIRGPFYPERGITRESLIAYAEECEVAIKRFANGGAHDYVLGKTT